MSKSILHTAESRGTTNQGWFHSRHTFSFGGYYNPEQMHFGELRVINDNILAPGKGFGMHPHSNMEVVTIPLDGELEYKDDMNNVAVIGKGEIQVMSAGTGVFHSEGNHNKDKSVRYLQIWIIPKILKAKPRHEQNRYELKNSALVEILSPDLHDGKAWAYQDAWMYIGKANAAQQLNFQLKNPNINGVYIFVIEGEIVVDEQYIKQRDGYGLWEISDFNIIAKTDAEFLIIEVPMKA